jgi:hypothetical protein
MIVRNSEFLKSTSCLKNSQGVWDNFSRMCNLLQILVLGLMCGVLVSLDFGWIQYH